MGSNSSEALYSQLPRGCRGPAAVPVGALGSGLNPGQEENLTSEAIRPDGVIIREISPSELKDRIDRGHSLVLVDVREHFERELADLPDLGQLRIPVKEIPFCGDRLDPDAEIVLYCRSGPRSAWATERLMEMGFSRVLNLRGGVLGWRAEVDPHLPRY